MAKVSMVRREIKRAGVVAKYKKKRAALKKTIKAPASSPEERAAAIIALQRQPRNASPCRLRNRCRLTGRPRGYYRKFGLGRNKLREHAMEGDIPGLIKASW